MRLGRDDNVLQRSSAGLFYLSFVHARVSYKLRMLFFLFLPDDSLVPTDGRTYYRQKHSISGVQ